MVQKNSINKVVIICGPTASGKSALALEVAKLLNTEIICADALTVYKNLNIGTAKITLNEQQGITHHLIDVVEPTQSFSVGDYKEFATPILNNLIKKGKIPVICGGTGFYINSLIYDMSYGNSIANLESREKYFNLAKEFGNEHVYRILMEKDPESAKKLHYNDLKRVVRALEIFDSGFLKSEIKDNLVPKFDTHCFSFDFPREILYERINNRVDQMIQNGLVGEVEELVAQGITDKNQCLQAIGYKEIYSYLIGQISLNEAIEQIKLNTRHYAKRQITFFKKMPNIKYLQPDNVTLIANRIVESLW